MSANSQEEVRREIPGAVERVGPRGRTRRIAAKGLAVVERMAREGHAYVAIAKALRMHEQTFRRCRKDQPEVQRALDLGLAANEYELTDILMQQAREGNIVACLFLLKCRHGWREGDAPDQRPNIVINLPDSHTPERYLELLNRGSGSLGGREVGVLPVEEASE